MTVPANAEHPCTAFTFMNYLLDAENGATLTNWNYYGSPNEASFDLVELEVLEFYARRPRPRVWRSSRTPGITRSTSPTIWRWPRADQLSIRSRSAPCSVVLPRRRFFHCR